MQKLQHFSAFTTFQLAKINMSDESFRVCIFLLEKSFYKHGVCNVSMSEIAESCFYAKTKRNLEISIPSYLSQLEKLKIIEIKKEKGATNTYKLLNLDYAKTKSKDPSEKYKEIEKKEAKKVYKKPVKPVQVQTVTQVHEEKQVQAHKVQTRPMFCDEIAAEWVAWRREKGLENGFPLEEYATYIHNAYAILPVQNHDFWMKKILDYIKQSDFWGEQGACDTPHQLSKKMQGTQKILKIYQELNSSKNRKSIIKSHINDSIKDDPDFKDLSDAIGF